MADLRHLRYFLAVAEELNFTRAAERLRIAQPPLSRQIRDLEDDIGASLFDRSTHPLKLTEAGQFLREEAREILVAFDRALDGAGRIGVRNAGWIGIGFLGSAMYGFLPKILCRFRQQHPKIEINLTEMSADQQVTALRDRRIHIGFLRPRIETDEFEQEVVQFDTLAIALQSTHPLAKATSVTFDLLGHEPFVAYGGHLQPNFCDYLRRLCKDAGIKLQIAMEVDQPETALGAVAAGFGISLVPLSLAGQGREGVVVKPISDRPPSHPLLALYRRNESSSAFHDFLEIVRTKDCASRS
ncbi:LysR substrate-binding domain-containing protein [Dongia soli]|uniref:LysR substrate-binding domain-containing protein n=1 Tax=Dongia soli TaxID=600628 RepID=A0ABU5EBT6_9PROT|nr:LysR substrate-binding domain-containing protein [Dongia soli]MDY0883842.1 LysR substrate-binding domain-containing protein [Dongia soli]